MKQIAVFYMIIALMMEGCNLQLKNHSPKQMPNVRGECVSASCAQDCLYPASTPKELNHAFVGYRHKFLLEIKPGRFVSVYKAFVNVNGVENEMKNQNGGALYTYTYPNCDVEVLNYYFHVNYHRGGLPRLGVQDLKDAGGQPFTATVVKSIVSPTGTRWVWWSGYGNSGPLRFNADVVGIVAAENGGPGSTGIFIQSVGTAPLRINNVIFDPRPGTNPEKFQITDVNTSALDCQDYTVFHIKWTPIPPDFDDKAYVYVQFDIGQGMYDGFYIELKTLPYQPAR
jgi:hypothetical protein